MKKISKEEFDHLTFQPKGKKVDETVLEILKLNLNEAMIVRSQDWKLKQQPSAYFYINAEKFNGMSFRCRKLANNEGWAIIRIA